MIVFYKKNKKTIKIIGTCLLLIGICLLLVCIGSVLSRLGDPMSHIDAQGYVHEHPLMLGGLLLYIAGYIGIIFTALGYLLWGVWKYVTTYVYRRK
jgi:hypothetical protein